MYYIKFKTSQNIKVLTENINRKTGYLKFLEKSQNFLSYKAYQVKEYSGHGNGRYNLIFSEKSGIRGKIQGISKRHFSFITEEEAKEMNKKLFGKKAAKYKKRMKKEEILNKEINKQKIIEKREKLEKARQERKEYYERKRKIDGQTPLF